MMNESEANTTVHQLPNDCYPPTDSDDESFVVLEKCVDNRTIDEPTPQTSNYSLLSADVIDHSLDLTADALNQFKPAKVETTSRETSTTTFNSDDLQRNVEQLIEENEKLKDTLRQNNLTMKNQYDTMISWQSNVEKVHESHKQKFNETKDYIKKLKTEIARLNTLVDLKNNEPVVVTSSETPSMDVVEIRNDKAMIIEQAKKINEQEDLIKEMTEATQKLDLAFDEKEHGYLEQITALKVENESLKKVQLDGKEDNDKLQTQLNAAQALITEIRQKMKTQEANCTEHEAKLTEMQTMQTNLQELQEKNDLLTAQLELYKNDYESEKVEKRQVYEENNKLREDLQRIQNRNEDLIQEVESLRDRTSFVNLENVPSAPQEQQQARVLHCPACNFGFYNLRALENHVYRCIELDVLP